MSDFREFALNVENLLHEYLRSSDLNGDPEKLKDNPSEWISSQIGPPGGVINGRKRGFSQSPVFRFRKRLIFSKNSQ